MKKLRLVLALVALLAIGHVNAQNTSSSYRTAIGVKVYPGSFTIKHFIQDHAALEGLANFWSKGFRTTGLYELHYPLGDVDGLQWYVGPGAHIGFYDNKYYEGRTLFGIDGVVGIDYKLKGAPFNFSLDWNPSFEFGDGAGFQSWGGLAVRFTF